RDAVRPLSPVGVQRGAVSENGRKSKAILDDGHTIELPAAQQHFLEARGAGAPTQARAVRQLPVVGQGPYGRAVLIGAYSVGSLPVVRVGSLVSPGKTGDFGIQCFGPGE